MDFLMNINDNKAGLQGLDKDRINAIIHEASKNSLYSKHQEKRASRIQERIRCQKEIVDKLSLEQIRLSEVEMDRLVKRLEEDRDLSRTVVHIDMDAFYAAVEMRDDPSLRDKPMAVGSIRMLSTSNYIARRFGVRAAMAGYIGKKLCPQLIIVPTNFPKYEAVSEQVRAILSDYDPDFIAPGLDEAYVDITDYLRKPLATKVYDRKRYGGRCLCRLPRYDGPMDGVDYSKDLCEKCGQEMIVIVDQVTFGHSAEEVTKELRFRVDQETGLTASAGIAVNRRLAKICTDINKPNGQYYLPPVYERIIEFVKTLPIRKIAGIGTVTESMLKAIGVETCGDLYEKRGLLALIHSPSSTHFFLRVALGIGSTSEDGVSSEDGHRKSIGVERTFSATSDPDELLHICQKLCAKVSESMKKKNVKAKNVVLKTKSVEFDVKTRATMLERYSCDFEVIRDAAFGSLRSEIAANESKGGLRLRLMGVRVASFSHEEDGFGLKLPDITHYLRQPVSDDAIIEDDENSLDVIICDNITPSTSNLMNDADEKPPSSSSAVDNDGCIEILEEEDEDLSWVICPVCQWKFSSTTMILFNRHLDGCLNRKAISSIIKVQDKEFSPCDSGSTKKRKREGDKKKIKCKTIDDYFKPL